MKHNELGTVDYLMPRWVYQNINYGYKETKCDLNKDLLIKIVCEYSVVNKSDLGIVSGLNIPEEEWLIKNNICEKAPNGVLRLSRYFLANVPPSDHLDFYIIKFYNNTILSVTEWNQQIANINSTNYLTTLRMEQISELRDLLCERLNLVYINDSVILELLTTYEEFKNK